MPIIDNSQCAKVIKVSATKLTSVLFLITTLLHVCVKSDLSEVQLAYVGV